MPGSPEGSGGSSVNGGHYSDYGGERRVARVGSDSQWAGPQSAHYEGFGYQPTSSSHYYHYDEESGNGPYPYPSRLDLRYHYSDTPREESPEQRPFYQPPLSLSYPTYSPPAPYASPSCTFYGRESDGLDEIERAAEQRMQEASAMVSSTHHYRLPSNGPMVKMFRVFLDKQLNDSKLGAVLSEISLPALGDDEYGAGLRVKTVMEAEEMGEVGMVSCTLPDMVLTFSTPFSWHGGTVGVVASTETLELVMLLYRWWTDLRWTRWVLRRRVKN